MSAVNFFLLQKILKVKVVKLKQHFFGQRIYRFCLDDKKRNLISVKKFQERQVFFTKLLPGLTVSIRL